MRLATTMGWLTEAYGIRVNCIVPDGVATEEIQACVDSISPEQRRTSRVPDVPTTLAEIAGAVMRLVRDESLSGRVLVWWSGQPPGLIPQGDPGYAALEAF
jgi:NAD(P)-dependent dehydrogenase (short-subunit alcohol dehydrogenase family)